jgi:hypothetical protein
VPKSVHKRPFAKATKTPTTGAILGYGRVSREGQDLAQQRAALRAAAAPACSRRRPLVAGGIGQSFIACWTTSVRVTWSWSGSSIGYRGR